ncbi:hypothetical protein PS2_012315 [Malus domestica]
MVNNLRMCSDCHSLGKQQEAASYKERNFHSAARAGRFSHHVGSLSGPETNNMACLANEAASSSFSISNPYTYDVFLSFRGEDTRNNFTGHLYNALRQKGITTFIDDGIRRGENISASLLRAIEESTISIIVLSENYAESKWCLDELEKILECKKSKQQMVRSIFYKVDPSNVRNQRGSYGEALAQHERTFKDNIEKVYRWREALSEAASLCGWPFLDGYGTNAIKGIMVKVPEPYNHICLNAKSFSEMKDLKFFVNYDALFSGDFDYLSNESRRLDWPGCSLQSLPSNFHPMKLFALKMPGSCITGLWEGFKAFPNLTNMNFERCKFLEEIPDCTGIPNLKRLNLNYCRGLVEVHPSVGFLDKLVELRVRGCFNLVIFPRRITLKSLEVIDLGDALGLRIFQELWERWDPNYELQNLKVLNQVSSGYDYPRYISAYSFEIPATVQLGKLALALCAVFEVLQNENADWRFGAIISVSDAKLIRNYKTTSTYLWI